MEAKHAVTSLGALAQETRLSIYRLLVEAGAKGMSVGEIAADVETSGATLSFHLKELTHAGLIDARQEGRFIFYSANYDRMNELLGFLTENCCVRDGSACDVRDSACRPKRATRPIAKPGKEIRLTHRRAATR